MGTRLLLAVAVMMVVVTPTVAQPRRWFDLYDEAIGVRVRTIALVLE